VATRAVFGLLFLFLLATRLCHIHILWAEEDLPLAAAVQVLHGKFLYRDIWFDKPPLLAGFYLLWSAHAGWLLRLAGALYVLLVSWIAYLFGRDAWGRNEGLLAACLIAFFLTFGIPGAVMPLAADMLMVAPHLAAVYFAWRQRAFLSGLMAGIALLINSKAVFVAAVCAALLMRQLIPLGLGFVLPNLVVLTLLWASGALPDYIFQVWRLGVLYSQNTFVENPVSNGILRTLNWMGFQSAIVAGAVWFWLRDRTSDRWRLAVWAALSMAAVAAGWRFFPRYYLQLLPVIALAGARGIMLLGRCRIIVLALLIIPFVRFAPRYGMLAWDLAHGQEHAWRDVLMDQDSRKASDFLKQHARPGETLFVWGFRPDIWAYTRMQAASRFLESQPLTGVLADRHLTQSTRLPADWTAANRAELARSKPDWVVDGLGPYNKTLAITEYPDLRVWFVDYREVSRTANTIIYQRNAEATAAAAAAWRYPAGFR
jgi:hypothetical protein